MNDFNNGWIILLIGIILKYHKEIFELVKILTEILKTFNNELQLYFKRKNEIKNAKILQKEIKQRNTLNKKSSAEAIKKIRRYVKRRKREQEMSMELGENDVTQEVKTVERTIVRKEETVLEKIKRNKKLVFGVIGLLLLILANLPVLSNYKISIWFCEDKNREDTCELISNDLSDILDNLLNPETTPEP